MIEATSYAWPFLLDGLLVTVHMSAIVIISSLVVGGALGIAMVYGPPPLALLIRVFSDVIRGIPVLVLIFFIFYGLPVIGINLPSFAAAAVALTVFKAAQTVETTRGALQTIHHGQMEAAKSIGLTFAQRMAYVMLPQAIRRFLPPWINGVTDAVKGSALVSLLGVVDLMQSIQQVIARTFEPLPLYVVGAMIYVAINFSLSTLSRQLEARYAYIQE